MSSQSPGFNQQDIVARYAVTGQPVAHSLSPLIHRQFAADTGQALEYDLLPADDDDFAPTAARFFAAIPPEVPAGINITLPFKEQAAAWVDTLDPAAQLAGAVNTIRRTPDGSFVGYNTDGSGLLADLQHNLGWSIAHSRVLLIGAGGASRGVLDALLKAQPAELVLANRTVARAHQLVAQVAPQAPNVLACAPAEVSGAYDIVLNATSASLVGQGALVPTTAVKGARCYDMLYAPTQTVFSGWALSHGAAWAVDGLGMLLEQAAAAFELWRGVRPATAALIDRRNDLFAAKRAGYATLAGWLASEDYQRWQVGAGGTADNNAAAPGVAVGAAEKHQFIAGAVCPECRAVDRIVVRKSAAGKAQACVACGYVSSTIDAATGDAAARGSDGSALVPQGKHERPASIVAKTEEVQAVRFVNPTPASKPPLGDD